MELIAWIMSVVHGKGIKWAWVSQAKAEEEFRLAKLYYITESIENFKGD